MWGKSCQATYPQTPPLLIYIYICTYIYTLEKRIYMHMHEIHETSRHDVTPNQLLMMRDMRPAMSKILFAPILLYFPSSNSHVVMPSSDGFVRCTARTGWRMGAFVFPPPLRWILDAMAVYASETHSAVSAPIQFGSLPAFRMHQNTEEQGN